MICLVGNRKALNFGCDLVIALKILVYEHACGGGYAGDPLPTDGIVEGFAMLRCVVADFVAAGHSVTVLLDPRLFEFRALLEAQYILEAHFLAKATNQFVTLVKDNEAVFVIAPETSHTLEHYVQLAEQTGKTVLNSCSNALSKVTDKAVLSEWLQSGSYPIPQTLRLSTTDDPLHIAQVLGEHFVYPVIFKPVDGTSGSGVSLVRSRADIVEGVAKIKAVSDNAWFVVQEKIEGQAVSVSLLSSGQRAVALTLNHQHITSKGQDLHYEGGWVPFVHPKKDAIFCLAKQVVEFLGLQGYVGVDLLLGSDTVFIIEVNARLTTSYVGLRQVMTFNIAQALIDAVVEGQLPNCLKTLGVACFSKTPLPKLSPKTYLRAARHPGIVVPPFPFVSTPQNAALLLGYGKSIWEAQYCLEEIKKTLTQANQ